MNTKTILPGKVGQHQKGKSLWAACLVIAGVLGSEVVAIEYPTIADSTERNYRTNQATGVVMASLNGSRTRGSGVVARHSQLVYTCAHVVWENGQWVPPSGLRFHRAYHSRYSPSSNAGQSIRGYRYYTRYSSRARQNDSTNAAFHYDFSIMYGYSSFGSATAYYATSGGANVISDRWKYIVGYPKTVSYNKANGYYYQHNTDFFRIRGYQRYGGYYGFQNVGTGGGNSGGPVFVRDSGGTYGLAAILVSGVDDGTRCGIRVLDGSTYSMGTECLEGLGYDPRIRKTMTNSKRLRIPDGVQRYSKRSVSASGFVGNVHTLNFSTKITTPYRGDLDVYLKSPSGRTKWISRNSGGGRNHLKVKKNLTSSFRGQGVNGRWTLYMRDHAKRDRCTFRSFSLKISD